MCYYIGSKPPFQWARFIKNRKKKMVLNFMEPYWWDLRINKWQEHQLLKLFPHPFPPQTNTLSIEAYINGRWVSLDYWANYNRGTQV